jgi:hypothetical protein
MRPPHALVRGPPPPHLTAPYRHRHATPGVRWWPAVGRAAVAPTHRPSAASKTAATTTTEDPATWERSPEWYGSQGGGWGRDDGRVVFAETSTVGNGRVTVTAHASSAPPLPGADRAEWRVLRFGDTRQSVALVDVAGGSVTARPGALAFEYVKTVVVASAAVLGAMPPGVLEAAVGDTGGSPPSILCVGVGGGSVPHALAAAFPGATVTGVELCSAVLGAAPTMGLVLADGGGLPNLKIVGGDGVEVLGAAAPGSVDLLVVDAFDGADAVPPPFCVPGGAGLVGAATALHPSHGAVVINLHAGPKPGPLQLLQRGFFGGGGSRTQPPTFVVHPDGSGPGAAAVAATRAWAECIHGGGGGGPAFMVGVRRQANAVGVVGRAAVRGLGSAADAAKAAQSAAARSALPLPYDVGDRASYGWWAL